MGATITYSSTDPDFFDTPAITLAKILQVTNAGGGSGPGGGGGESGSGSPEGVVTAEPGTTYLDAATGDFYAKQTGSGNTGWLKLIAA